MNTMIIRHIIFYIAGIFRKYELKRYGTPDIHGIIRAKWESYLRTSEVVIDWFAFGYVLKHMIEISQEEFQNQIYYSYWIFIDSILILLL